jgi:hypothetical protein
MTTGKSAVGKWLRDSLNDPAACVQVALFVVVCMVGYYIDYQGTSGGSSTPDALHVYVVKFNRASPRYLTSLQEAHFRLAFYLLTACLIISMVLLIGRIIFRAISRSSRG